MRNKTLLAAVAALWLLAVVGAEAADRTLPVTVDVLVQQLAARFSPAVGKVVEAETSRPLVVAFAEGTYPQADQELLLYRPGEDVVNKLTGERLGGFDQVIGLVKVVEVRQGLGRVELLQLKPDMAVRPGDTVKYSSRLDAVVEPPKFFGATEAGTENVADMLSLSLERAARFRPALMSQGDQGVEVWRDNRYGFRVLPIVSSDEAGPRLDLRVFSLYTGKPLFVIGENFSAKGPLAAEASSERPRPSSVDVERLRELEERLKALEESKKAEKSPAINPDINQVAPVGKISAEEMQRFRATQDLSQSVHLQNIAMGDIDGDGKDELVGMGQNFLKFYRWNGAQFAEFHTIKGSSRSNFLNVDIANINGVGPAEIFVTHMKTTQGIMNVENKLDSFVLEFRGGQFTKIWSRQPYYLRVLKSPQLGRGVLLAQEMGTHEMYHGPVMQFRWSGSTYVKEPSSIIPPQFFIYGFMIADLKESGTPEFFVLQDSGHLAAFNQGVEPTWTSRDRLGGFNHVSFKQLPRHPSREKYIRTEATTDEMLVDRYLKGRMEVVHLGSPEDGHYGLLVGSNQEPMLSQALLNTTVLENGRVVHYAWNGIQYVREWETQPTERHYLADFAIGDLEGDGTQDLVLLLHTTKIVTNPTSRLELYRLGKQP